MDDYTSQKDDIDAKLQREMSNLALLTDALAKSEQNTQSMMSVLSTFESRLMKLEDMITPVYQETGNLQRRHENIEKTLSVLNDVIDYYHVAEDVEPTIREGPSGGLENYLTCMERLQKAVQYFTKNNPGTPEMSHVMTLFEAGKDALEREFRNLLTRHSKPVPAIIMLDALMVDEELPHEEVPVIEHLPGKVLSELSQIAQWLVTYGENADFIQVYSTIRSSILVKSLKVLKEHVKAGSKDSGTSNLTSSPAMGPSGKVKPQKDTPTRKVVRKLPFMKKGMGNALKHMPLQLYGIESSLALGGFKQRGNTTDIKEDELNMEIENYITCVSALLKLVQSESQLMHGIVPEKFQRKIFDMLIQSGLDSIIKEGEQIANSAKRAIGKHEFSALLAMFPVVRHLRMIKPDFNVALEGCQAPTRSKLATLISTLDSTGAKALEGFIDTIRNDPDKSSHMPKDGTVHELTSNTIVFLEHLLDFSDTAGAMLMSQDPTALPEVNNPNKPKLKLAEYITKVLSALGLNLSNKAETYNDVTIRSIFMLNNYNYILKSLKRSGILELVHMWNPDVEHYYDDQILDQKRVYSQSWSRVLHYVMDKTTPPGGSKSSHLDLTKLKEKDRQSIKDKFTGFNREMEDIHRIQKAYAIPESDLRESLKKDNKDFILPQYHAFLKRYQPTNFTKNPDKYIKFTVANVAECIDQFFDSTA